MRSILKFSAVALTVFSVAAQSANAQFVQQNTRPVGTTTTWDQVTATNSYSIGNVTASTTGGNWAAGPFTAGGNWAGGFTNGDYLLFGFGNTVTTLDFTGAIYGFGTQGWNNPCCGGTMTLQAYFLGNLVGSFSQAIGGGAAANNNQAAVIGFTSTSAVDRVVLTSTSEFAINQIDVDGTNPIVTPEPTSAAMLAGALVALGFAVRRRNKRAI